MHYIRSFLKGHEICRFHGQTNTLKAVENGIILNYTSMSKFRCDIKYMYRASTGHKFILVVTDEVTNYLVTIPLYRGPSHKARETLIIMNFVNISPSHLILDEDHKLYLV